MPAVSVLLAVHDDARYLGAAIDSVLRQTYRDFELIVVDDASDAATQAVLDAVADPRLVVLRNDEQSGLAASLNRGLGHAGGRYIARLDSDDVALPERLARQLQHIEQARAGAVGTAVRDLDAAGRAGRCHRLPRGARALRWHALFSSPFFHPTVLVDRELLDRHRLRYDAEFLESEDYDLWTRLFAAGADGANLEDAHVLKRVHAGQASLRRRELQRTFQLRVARREIERAAPTVDAELAWSFATGETSGADGAAAYLDLLREFEARQGTDPEVRRAVRRRLLRARQIGPALRLPRRTRRRTETGALRVVVVSPEPTPYRAPLFDRIAARDDIDLTVVYAARTVASRTWSVALDHNHLFLSGVNAPGARRVLRHDYPLTPGILRALRAAQPDVVVVSGWSTFASQAAIAWCRTHRVPFVLLVESHDLDPRAAWRRAVKAAAVPWIVRNAASVLVVGTLARDGVVGRGADSDGVRIFANTIDVERWIERAQRLPREPHDSVVVLSVGRRVPEKGFDVLEAACARAGVTLEIVTGGLTEDELARRYAEADIFALVSRHEPWGVVVNEAAASGLPLVLSSHVGAAWDLLDGNGVLVPPDDVEATAAALRRLAADPELRARMGTRSRELVRTWGYEPSVENFVAAVRDATASR